MAQSTQPVLSVVIPLHNEAASLPGLYGSLRVVLAELAITQELLFIDDGSTDNGLAVLADLTKHDQSVRVLRLSRNFGKELALTAGIHRARGQAILTLDADGQHPVDRIPDFVAQWRKGAKVVIGRRANRDAGLVKRLGAKLFYGAFSRLTGLPLDFDATDFRLIDRTVQTQFNKLTEHGRITRGLIDWLGYERAYVRYTEKPRLAGTSPYSLRKLLRLAVDSAISMSSSPLYITAYVGAVVLPLATILGLGMGIDWLTGDPLHLHARGDAYVTVLMLWLVGLLLVSQGIIGLYLSHIHAETQSRPLYLVDEAASSA
jgi:dolichol-phosphate mannosyltransferase